MKYNIHIFIRQFHVR